MLDCMLDRFDQACLAEEVVAERAGARTLPLSSSLAPEVVLGDGYGAPADMWAAGVLLYQLLTREDPFRAPTELEMVRAIEATTYAFAPDALVAVPAAAVDLVRRLLVRDPAARATADEALRHPFLAGGAEDAYAAEFDRAEEEELLGGAGMDGIGSGEERVYERSGVQQRQVLSGFRRTGGNLEALLARRKGGGRAAAAAAAQAGVMRSEVDGQAGGLVLPDVEAVDGLSDAVVVDKREVEPPAIEATWEAKGAGVEEKEKDDSEAAGNGDAWRQGRSEEQTVGTGERRYANGDQCGSPASGSDDECVALRPSLVLGLSLAAATLPPRMADLDARRTDKFLPEDFGAERVEDHHIVQPTLSLDCSDDGEIGAALLARVEDEDYGPGRSYGGFVYAGRDVDGDGGDEYRYLDGGHSGGSADSCEDCGGDKGFRFRPVSAGRDLGCIGSDPPSVSDVSSYGVYPDDSPGMDRDCTARLASRPRMSGDYRRTVSDTPSTAMSSSLRDRPRGADGSGVLRISGRRRAPSLPQL
jgi:Protein kinase domain